MPKRLISLFVFVVTGFFLFTAYPANAENGCTEMESEAEAIEGVVPKFEKNGRLKSISMYADATFLTPKRSLISAARKQAELKAKRDFSNFIKEKLAAGTLSESLMETASVTNEKGETVGTAEEINRVVDQISSNTEATLSGVVKLDECVNTEEKYLIVRLGWKPSLSRSASSAAQTMKNPPQVNKANNVSKSNPSESQQAAGESSSSSGIKIITVVVEGRGAEVNEAIRVGLRQAVSQVFGEQFESEIEITQTTQTVELSGPVSLGAALESTNQSDKSKSKTKGTIQSYEVISKQSISSAVIVSLKVSLAKYDNGIDRNKKSIIVLMPKTEAKQVGDDADATEFAKRVQSALEAKLNSSGKYNMLDREYLSDTMRELNFIASSNGSVQELARLGNHVGADLVVVTEVLSFDPKITSRTVGDREIKRGLLNAEMSLKLLDPATTKIVISETFSFRNQKVSSPGMSEYAEKAATRISGRIIRTSGGRSSARAETDDNQRKTASKEANQKFNALEEKHENNW